jgi:hypothetical protein
MFVELLLLVMQWYLLLLLQEFFHFHIHSQSGLHNRFPDASAVVPASGEPPVAALYHCKLVPVAVRFATVGLVLLQNVCGLVAVGAAVVVIVTVTGVLPLSHPLTV